MFFELPYTNNFVMMFDVESFSRVRVYSPLPLLCSNVNGKTFPNSPTRKVLTPVLININLELCVVVVFAAKHLQNGKAAIIVGECKCFLSPLILGKIQEPTFLGKHG